MPPNSELITVERDCEAILIPSGDPIKLIKGTHVRITQALGGDYTLFVNGNLVKISGADADAIGKDPEERKVMYPKPPVNRCKKSKFGNSSALSMIQRSQ